MATVRWDTGNYVSEDMGGSYTVAMKVKFDTDTIVTGVWFYSSATQSMAGIIWNDSGGVICQGGFVNASYNYVHCPVPQVTLTAGRVYYIGVQNPYMISYWQGGPSAVSSGGVTMRSLNPGGGEQGELYFGGYGSGQGVWPTTVYVASPGLLGVEASVANQAPYPPASIRINGSGTDWQWVRSNPQLAWNFSDPNAGNYQAYYHVQRCNSRGWGYIDYDTGGINTGNNWHDFSWSNQGTNYARVRTADQNGAWGDWSYITYQYDDGIPYASNAYSETPNTNTSSTFRVVVTGVGDGVSGAQIARFPTRVVNQTDFVWLDGWNAGGGTWACDISVPGTFGNRDGQYETHVYLYDNAGNGTMYRAVYTNVDRTKASDPNPVISSATAVSVTLNWNGFSDPGFSSGWRSTYLYFGEWNGSGWVGTPLFNGASIGNTTSYNIGNLKPNTLYRYTVTYYDNANNESYYTYKTFTTNAFGTSSLQNLASSGYLISQRPRFRAAWSDPAGDAGVCHIQISNSADFATTLVDAIADQAASYAGWQTKAGTPSGGTNYYTPQIDLGTGTKYARVQAWDGGANMWTPWSATYTFTIKVPVWTDTINAAATGVKKIWLDQLRQEINAIRQAHGLAVSSWTDPEVATNITRVKGVHLTELRTSIAEVASALGVTYTWTDPTITVNTTERKGQHWKELRDLAVRV